MTQLFHKDIGIPEALTHTLPYPMLRYGNHAQAEARKEGLSTLPRALPNQFDIVEVEAANGKPTKWVLRFSWRGCPADRHLVLVVTADGFVKTVWTNHIADTHKTLQSARYTPPTSYTA
jgi:hypothetical protein